MSPPEDNRTAVEAPALKVGESLSLHIESGLGRVTFKGTIRVVGRHHVKAFIDEGPIPGWIGTGDTARIRLVDRPGCLPLSSRVARIDGVRRLIVLALPEATFTTNRRRFARVDVEIPCTVFTLAGLHLEGTIRNISGGGFLLEVGTLVSLSTDEPVLIGLDDVVGRFIPVTYVAHVIRSGGHDGRTEVAVEFTSISPRSRDAVCRFVMRCEIEERKAYGGL